MEKYEKNLWFNVQEFLKDYARQHSATLNYQVIQDSQKRTLYLADELKHAFPKPMINMISAYLDAYSPIVTTSGNDTSRYHYSARVSDDIMLHGIEIRFENHSGTIHYFDGYQHVQLYWGLYLSDSEMRNGRTVIKKDKNNSGVLQMDIFACYSGDLQLSCSYKNSVLHGSFSYRDTAPSASRGEIISCSFFEGSLSSSVQFNLGKGGGGVIEKQVMNNLVNGALQNKKYNNFLWYYQNFCLKYMYLPTW